MGILGELAAWFTDPANWQGQDAIQNRFLEHLIISFSGIVVGALIALPIGLYIGHTGRLTTLAIGLTNIGRAIPSYAVMAILFPISISISMFLPVDLAFAATFGAMVLLAIPPIVTNTYTGLHGVDGDLVEAARGMGMPGSLVLRQVELPLALPVVLAGLSIASVQVVATATLGAVFGGGGLGRYIIQGIARHDDARTVAGALMVALLAMATELIFRWLQRRTVSPGLASAAHPIERREPDLEPI
jgi:osmoprotectant transport system permease protein